MTELRDVPAPAKLNLFLHVVGRREDGYHLLQTVFRFVDLADILHFHRRNDGRIRRLTEIPGVPEADCLTVRAAQALQRATGASWGVDIELEKRIPSGGGLGGGSSDAATVLLALNRLWGCGLSRRDLLSLALPLGADVPVFVFGQNAFAEGVGEALQAVQLPQRWYVVIQPQASVPTGAVFADPELTRDTPAVIITDFSSPVGILQSKSSENDDMGMKMAFDAGAAFGRNDLEPVVFKRYSQVAQARQVAMQSIQQAGIEPHSGVRMSGSGACLFIECVSRQHALLIKAKIAATIRFSDAATSAIKAVTVCEGLDQHPLQHWAE